jgi:lysophospholipase L1-like esterase
MKRIYTLLPVLLILSVTAGSQPIMKFDFGPGKVATGFTQVLPETLYNDEKGYGFEFSTALQSGSYTGKDALKNDFITSGKPFFFSVKVPEGNYKVKVTLGDSKGISKTTIKAECRRLMVEGVETAKGKFVTETFIVHVRDSIIRPGGNKVRLKPRELGYLHWDHKLTLEFSNAAPKICAVEITPVSNATQVFLAGNSTVVDQAYEPYASWGQIIPAFFKGEKIAVANYAESGETLKAFKGERRLDKIWSMAKPGDYLFIEFAHNDQKPGGNHLDPFTTYKETVKDWIAEAQRRGMIPVLVTSMNRRTFDSSGRITNSLGDYPEAIRQTGREENVPVIDLNAMSKLLYEALGPVPAMKAFVHYPANSFPNQPKALSDDTHFSPYGAYQLAKCVVIGIQQQVPALAKHLKRDLPAYDPARPDPPAAFQLPVSAFVGAVKPDGN